MPGGLCSGGSRVSRCWRCCSRCSRSTTIPLRTRTHRPKASTSSRAALLFWPEFAAALITAAIFGWLFRTRYTPVLALAGTTAMLAPSVDLLGLGSGGDIKIAIGSGLIGLGVGASVSPSLFIAGFSLRSA